MEQIRSSEPQTEPVMVAARRAVSAYQQRLEGTAVLTMQQREANLAILDQELQDTFENGFGYFSGPVQVAGFRAMLEDPRLTKDGRIVVDAKPCSSSIQSIPGYDILRVEPLALEE